MMAERRITIVREYGVSVPFTHESRNFETGFGWKPIIHGFPTHFYWPRCKGFGVIFTLNNVVLRIIAEKTRTRIAMDAEKAYDMYWKLACS